MRIAITGDTHGKLEPVQCAIKKAAADYIFFTGDYYRDGKKLATRLKIGYYGVIGNCDSQVSGPEEKLSKLMGQSFYMVHGHQYGVKHNLQSLYYRAQELEADVVIFGHTHVPLCQNVEGLWMLNPGSPARPRTPGKGSFIILDCGNGRLLPRIEEL
ncbi:metallophosphoesterase family protein [Syntrophomonas erecta]